LDSYLEIAKSILRLSRRPLSARAILNAAFDKGLVPYHLHGTTQHKTLQARLSESIINDKERSPFFRTSPGRFFLREFLEDNSIPWEFRRPISTRRRKRELSPGPSLAINFEDLRKHTNGDAIFKKSDIISYLNRDKFIYVDASEKPQNYSFIRSFVYVKKKNHVLTYRPGKYREDRYYFHNVRTFGFSSLVDIEKRDLFTWRDFGILFAGVSAVQIDLNIPSDSIDIDNIAKLLTFVKTSKEDETPEMLAAIEFKCPDWFEPTTRRLAINDLTWEPIGNLLNQIDDFDPWSQDVIRAIKGA
jgi:HB1, ASXL, restriction endonuclease HTH domain